MVGPTEGAVFTVLGSGTLEPDGDRASASHHLSCAGHSVLLDCGSGALHGLARHGIDWERLTHVLITHYHYDHIGDLPALLIALKLGARPARTRPLTLVGPVGLERHLRGLAEALGIGFLEPGFHLAFVEVEPSVGPIELGSDLVIAARSTPHTSESLAYRLSGRWGAVGYTGDTGPEETLGAFFESVDLLVAECSYADPPPMDTHLTPRSLAELARAARPGALVVTHVYPPLEPSEAVELVRSLHAGRVVEGRDGLRVAVEPPISDVDLDERVRYT